MFNITRIQFPLGANQRIPHKAQETVIESTILLICAIRRSSSFFIQDSLPIPPEFRCGNLLCYYSQYRHFPMVASSLLQTLADFLRA